ncbi:hypothetical protein B0H63DRAFT_476182 [Podospora didyma]|uniref:CID domain-containing protein n=1 Tax=Podospora didyma TaxID=330526 RepID=A0AAE0NHK7_9PEZI|nr:hypothetical protein B0H63DRAFT_476182 [Podospora didyma]
MSSSKKIAEFPDVEAKLQRPTKQSAFERQKAEAEAKRRREDAETKAAYEEFVKTFNGDDGPENSDSAYESRGASSRYGAAPPERPTFAHGVGTGRRHFGATEGKVLKSGPGSLGPVPPAFGAKRPYDGPPQNPQRESNDRRERLGFEAPTGSSHLPVSRAYPTGPDEHGSDAIFAGRAEEKAISKPTLRLANIPPGTSRRTVEALIPSTLTVEDVKFEPPPPPGGTERKSTAVIVTLAKDTAATDIDSAVTSLQNRYLGYGFYLSIHRYLSSAAISSGLPTVASSAAISHPFGAKRVEETMLSQPAGYGRGYAPPSSYGPPAGGPLNRGGLLAVPVSPPQDIKKLRMIHKVLEAVIQHGAEFEALLMSRPDVQRDEKWAWIWDARSEGGIWYRWRLWEILTDSSLSGHTKASYVPLFEGAVNWKAPDHPLAYEYTTGVDQFRSDPNYVSDDDDDLPDEQRRQAETSGGNHEQEDKFLNPIEKAKLAHLLARIPTRKSHIKKGDIARVTAFAITHVNRGADEIVDMVISNIESPFAYTSANANNPKDTKQKDGQREDSHDPTPAPTGKALVVAHGTTDPDDAHEAQLVGLYVVSDILSASGESGVRHAWRYRQLFESALRNRKIFEMLGKVPDRLNFGRVSTNKWQNSVRYVLRLWGGWCVFQVSTYEFFVNTFEEASVSKKEVSGAETEKKDSPLKKSRGFLPVSELPSSHLESAAADVEKMLETGDTDGELPSSHMQYSSGAEEIFSDDDLDGYPDEDFRFTIGGRDGAAKTAPLTTAEQEKVKSIGGFKMSALKAVTSRKRLRAVDMFAGSDSEEN